MKGKNPTRKQKNIIKENKLNPDNWLVLKILKNRICIQPKVSKINIEIKMQHSFIECCIFIYT